MIEGVRGTRTLEGDEARKYKKVINTFSHISEQLDFVLIKLPSLEREELFSRTVGEFSDIVTKQMFSFSDKKGRKLVLRPEGTAGVMRNYVEKNYKKEKKYFYSEQMYRYERPQKGRYREFHQVGAEIIGAEERSIRSIVDIVILGVKFLTSILPIDNKYTLNINSIGTNNDRKKYITKLYEYYKLYETELSEESQKRLDTNPLRILDSKDKNDKLISFDAPKLNDYISKSSNEDFTKFKSQISDTDFKEDPNLVRGLDYYNGITFEFVPNESIGSQDTLGGGGQYDSLSSFIGSRQINGVGLAFGVDRIMELID